MSAPHATGLARPLSPSGVTPSRAAAAVLRAVLRTVLRTVRVWTGRRAARHALGRLEPHLLRDIGLMPEAAAAEAQKPFWRG